MGEIILNGVVIDDNFSGFNFCGYLFVEGEFVLQCDYILLFDVKFISDQVYLLDYDYGVFDCFNSELVLICVLWVENMWFVFNYF